MGKHALGAGFAGSIWHQLPSHNCQLASPLLWGVTRNATAPFSAWHVLAAWPGLVLPRLGVEVGVAIRSEAGPHFQVVGGRKEWQVWGIMGRILCL